MSKKTPFLDAQQEFIKRGYEPLFSEEFYKTCNNKTTLPYRCPHHPERNNKIGLHNLKKGHGCMKCGDEAAAEKNKTPYLDAIQEFIKRGYEPLFDEEFYKTCTNKTPLSYRCPHHPERENKIRLDSLKSGKGCKACKASKLEKWIYGLIKPLGRKFRHDKTVKGLVYKGPLRIDFNFTDDKLWIEAQGVQHYKPVDFAGRGEQWAAEQLEENKKRDAAKDKFAKEHGIFLWRIPHFHRMTDEQFLSILSHYTNRK